MDEAFEGLHSLGGVEGIDELVQVLQQLCADGGVETPDSGLLQRLVHPPDPTVDARIARLGQSVLDVVWDAWLNPPDLVDVVPEVVPGSLDRILPKNAEAAEILKKLTLIALYNTRGTPEGGWLDGLHRRLDKAEAAGYGWPADIAEDDALVRLLVLNLACSGGTRARCRPRPDPACNGAAHLSD